MGVSQEADSLEFAGYLAVLRRRWWIILVLACVGILAAGAYIAVSPKGYTATPRSTSPRLGSARIRAVQR